MCIVHVFQRRQSFWLCNKNSNFPHMLMRTYPEYSFMFVFRCAKSIRAQYWNSLRTFLSITQVFLVLVISYQFVLYLSTYQTRILFLMKFFINVNWEHGCIGFICTWAEKPSVVSNQQNLETNFKPCYIYRQTLFTCFEAKLVQHQFHCCWVHALSPPLYLSLSKSVECFSDVQKC